MTAPSGPCAGIDASRPGRPVLGVWPPQPLGPPDPSVKKPEIVPREEILEVLRAAAPRALHIGAIGSELGITKNRRRALGELLEDLALAGRVDVLPGARYRISQQTLER